MNIKNSTYTTLCEDIYSSRFIYSSRDIYLCCSIDLCSNLIFCYEINLKENYAFNKQLKEERVNEIIDFWNEIKGDFKLNLKDNSWEDEWKKLPTEVWKKLATLPEFDKSVVENVIGFELDLSDPKEMTVAEISKELGYEVKIIK